MATPPRVTGDGSSIYNGITVNTPFDNEKDAGVKVEDFLQLMIAQLSNQDFMNPVDDTQYVSQLAQFATMQSMQELSHYSQTSYVSSLVGKTVTVATLGLGGSVNREIGVVSKVNISGDGYTVTVNGKEYQLSQIMNIADANTVTKNELLEAGKIVPTLANKTEDSLKFRWDAPTDNDSSLVYDVYYTEEGTGVDMSTLEGVKKGTLAVRDHKGNEFEITGLEPGKTYKVNVIVRNAAGDEAVYQYTTGSTLRGDG